MKIHLVHQSKVEGKSLSLFLEENGNHVVFKNKYYSTPSIKRVDSNTLILLDTNFISDLESCYIKQIVNSYDKIVLLGHLDEIYLYFYFYEKSGGFICRKDDANQLLVSIKQLKWSKYIFSPSIFNFLGKTPITQQESLFQYKLAQHLTKTELNIMREIAEGKTAQEIAKSWHRSTHTVYNHRKNVRKKLGLNGNLPLNKFCYERKSSILTLLSLINKNKFLKSLIENN